MFPCFASPLKIQGRLRLRHSVIAIFLSVIIFKMSSKLQTSTEEAYVAQDSTEKDEVAESAKVDVEKEASLATSNNQEWVSGVKLWIIMTGVTLVCFLMLLDVSILSTVRKPTARPQVRP